LPVVIWRPTLSIVKCSKFEYICRLSGNMLKCIYFLVAMILRFWKNHSVRSSNASTSKTVPSIVGKGLHVARMNIYLVHSYKFSEILTKLHNAHQSGVQRLGCL
jgi:hypothetical protein